MVGFSQKRLGGKLLLSVLHPHLRKYVIGRIGKSSTLQAGFDNRNQTPELK